MKKSEVAIAGMFFVFLIVGGISWALITRGGVENSDISKDTVEVKGVTDLGFYPKVINIAPNLAPIDNVYTFSPKVVVTKGDIDAIQLELIDGPDWLFLESNRLFGIPGANDIGDSKVTLRVWNRTVYSDFIFYVKVYEENGISN